MRAQHFQLTLNGQISKLIVKKAHKPVLTQRYGLQTSAGEAYTLIKEAKVFYNYQVVIHYPAVMLIHPPY